MDEVFPNDQWIPLRERMESEGPEGVIAFVATHDDLQRRQLWSFAVGAFGRPGWTRNMDWYVTLAHAGIDDCLRQAAAAPDPETAAKRTDLANVLAYDAGASLCDCWDDGPSLEVRHFEAGLALAERCLAWREALGKGPWPRAMAWWLKGMHLLSLGRPAESAAAFERSAGFARDHAAGAPLDFGVVLSEGYLGISETRAGRPGGETRYAGARVAFEQMAATEEKREDAAIGLAQLQTVKRRYP